MSEEFNYIYSLIDPFNNEVRYIGKSCRPKERLTNQCNERSNTYRCHWIQSVLKKGLRPIQNILETLTLDQDWQARERHWIAYYRTLGSNLTNCTDGGDGVLNLSGESKERMLRTWKGRKHKPETLIKLSLASKGRRKTSEQKENMRKKMLGRNNDWGCKVAEGVRKISKEQAEIIRVELSNGLRVIEAAKKYSIHRTTITKIKHGNYFTYGQPSRKSQNIKA